MINYISVPGGFGAEVSSTPLMNIHPPRHAYPQHGHSGAVARLPVIPDLRFEYSYLRSIQPYVHVERGLPGKRIPTEVEKVDQGLLDEGLETLDASLGRTGKGFAEGDTALSSSSETITVQWGKVLWVTMRDQVISPLLQGALWALASYYVRPFSAELGSKMGTIVHNKIPAKEGLGVSWLRGWAKNIGLSGYGVKMTS